MRLTERWKDNRWLVLFVVLGLLAGLWQYLERFEAEYANKTVELAIDLDEYMAFARSEGYELEEVLSELKSAGVTSVAVPEVTPRRLVDQGKATLVTGEQLVGWYVTGKEIADIMDVLAKEGRVKENATYMLVQDTELADWLESSFEKRLPLAKWRVHKQEDLQTIAFELDYGLHTVRGLNLGLAEHELNMVRDMGFLLIPRVSNYDGVSAEEIEATLDYLSEYELGTLIFGGNEVLGYPDYLDTTARVMSEHDMSFGMVEAVDLLGHRRLFGQEKLANLLDYQVVRVYSMSFEYMAQLSDEEVSRILSQSAFERNIRVLYLRPLYNADDRLGSNVGYISKIHDRLIDNGFNVGKASTLKPIEVSFSISLMVMLGTFAAALLVLDFLVDTKRYRYWLFIAGSSLIVGLSLTSLYGLLVKGMALLAAIVLPTLGLIWLLRYWKQLMVSAGGHFLVSGILASLVALGFSLTGGVYVAALLGDIRHMLEIEFFRGVKLSFVLPFVPATVLYIKYFGIGREPKAEGNYSLWQEAALFLRKPVTVGHLVLLGVVLVAGLLYIVRSGNVAGEMLLPFEREWRSFLETTFMARPRNKEVLVGYPGILLGTYLAWRRWPSMIYLFVIMAGMGMVSVVNSFEHIRTPVMFSTLRSLYGFGLGVGLGVLLVLGFHYIVKMYVQKEGSKE